MPSTYEPIATQTLGSTASSVTFSSIPSTYTDLVLVVNSIGSGTSYMKVKCNGDTTTANYSTTILEGDGSAASSLRYSNTVYLAMIGTVTTTIGNQIVHFMNYSNTTTFKTILARDNSSIRTRANVALFKSTAAISSLEIDVPDAPNFAAGSTFTLYGIKAA
jgi:hypothetical protein